VTSTRPVPLLAVLSFAAALACPACDGSSGSGTSRAPSSGGLIRLADLLELATIRTPLTEISAARSTEQLRDIPRQPIFLENFEEFDIQAAGWPDSPEDSLVETELGRSFLLHGRTGLAPRSNPRAWSIPAEPNTHYVFERRVKTGAPLIADFEIFEAGELSTVEALFKPGGDTLQAMLKVHWPPDPEPDGEWQRGSVSFFTMPYTRALVIVLWATSRRSTELSRAEVAADTEAWFDEVRLSRLDPTPEQSIALFKGQHLADGADPALGMQKYGQFPPLPKSPYALGPSADNYAQRYALYAPPPTELAFPLTLDRDAVLRFSVGLSRETRRGHAARFEVQVHADGREETLWSSTLTATPKTWLWHPAQVDLSAYAGQSVQLVLRTSAVKGTPHPLWSNPVIDLPLDGEGPSNVILIAVDTLRADRLSSFGYEHNTSPRLDALAADGVRFDQVASNATWTCPSFASIFTGLVPSRHGVWVAGPLMRLPLRFETLAERFRAHGWATHSIAYKAPLYSSGYDQGFDVSFNAPRRITRADDNLARAMEWLERNAERRNFLFLHFNDPHQPFSQPAPFDSMFGPLPEEVRLPFSVESEPPRELRDTASTLYDGEVAYVDDRIGMFIDALKSRGLYDDAVIVFVSDHGEELWEHGGFGHSRGKLYDEAIRVPLIVKPARGSFPPDRVVAAQVRAFDVMPTLLELAGIPVPDDLDARSLVPLLSADGPDRLAVIETAQRGLAVRTRKWKYILETWLQPMPRELLFDLQADALEQHDVAAQQPERVARMRLQALDYLMLNRPGRYLVVIAADSAPSGDLVLRGVNDSQALYGPAPQLDEDGSLRIEGGSPGPLVLVARLRAGESILVGEADAAPRNSIRYAYGDLDRLLRNGAAGVHLFEGPKPAVEDVPAPRTMDEQQLEALRALGYLGDGEPDRDDC
jgi:arylsulfatase A-like enzyme